MRTPTAHHGGVLSAVAGRHPEDPDPVDVVEDVTKRYGSHVALDRLSFTVRQGAVTAFLGPNGAGKTTLIRVLVGFDRPDAGSLAVFGRAYRRLAFPARDVGVLVDGAGFHPSLSARRQLRALADAAGVPRSRVSTALSAVGLRDDADRRVRAYSLGMRRRLGLAAALLGDPRLLILDEPANGLDPAGIRWLRHTLRAFADEGGTVLVSSHVLAEVEQTADDVVLIDKGRLVTQTSVAALTATSVVVVRTPTPEALGQALASTGARIDDVAGARLEVSGVSAEVVADRAAAHGVTLHELKTRSVTLEDVFLDLTESGGDRDPV